MKSSEAIPKALSRDFVLPHDLDAEIGVLGSLLMDHRIADDVALTVRSDDFFNRNHAIVFRHMMNLHNSNRSIEARLLIASLKKSAELAVVGGEEALIGFMNSLPIASNGKWYAKIVADKAIARNVLEAAADIVGDVLHPSAEPREILAKAESRLFAVGERAVGSEAKPIFGVLMSALDAVDKRRDGQITTLRTGYDDLDKLISGFGPGQLVILAGRPHMGKTALATCLMENIAEHGKAVLFVSLEMTDMELGARLLAQRSRVPLYDMSEGTLSDEGRRKLVKGSNELAQMKIVLDDHPTRTVSEIAAVCRREKRRNGLDLVIVDYLTNIEPDNYREQRQEQVAKLSRKLKALARELSVPLLCLAQLNREVDKGLSPIPKLSHLRESGAIEQDADIVLMVHRPEYFADKDEDKAKLAGQAELYVRKCRNGKCGSIGLTFLAECGRFETKAQDRYESSAPRQRAYRDPSATAERSDFGDYGDIPT